MGHRTTQRILDCAVCGKTPDNGAYMWEMNSEYWCEDCCNDDHEDAPDISAFEGTREALNNLGRKEPQ